MRDRPGDLVDLDIWSRGGKALQIYLLTHTKMPTVPPQLTQVPVCGAETPSSASAHTVLFSGDLRHIAFNAKHDQVIQGQDEAQSRENQYLQVQKGRDSDAVVYSGRV